jgi:hypothetical protein
MFINKTEVTEILRVMKEFPRATNFELIETSGSGIGSVMTLIVHTEVKDIPGNFAVEISRSVGNFW